MMEDQPDQLARMTLELIQKDPNKSAALEFRIAAMKAAAAILEQELSRHFVLASMSNHLTRK